MYGMGAAAVDGEKYVFCVRRAVVGCAALAVRPFDQERMAVTVFCCSCGSFDPAQGKVFCVKKEDQGVDLSLIHGIFEGRVVGFGSCGPFRKGAALQISSDRGGARRARVATREAHALLINQVQPTIGRSAALATSIIIVHNTYTHDRTTALAPLKRPRLLEVHFPREGQHPVEPPPFHPVRAR